MLSQQLLRGLLTHVGNSFWEMNKNRVYNAKIGLIPIHENHFCIDSKFKDMNMILFTVLFSIKLNKINAINAFYFLILIKINLPEL